MSIVFKDRKGANFKNISFLQRISMFFIDHVRQMFASIGELYRTPLATIMTVAVLGISITLPGVLYILVKNTEAVTENWQKAAEISLFLKQDVTSAEANQLVTRLSLRPEIKEVKYISADDALQEFVLLSGLGDAIEYLETNPLPSVVTVSPTQRHATPRAAENLVMELKKEREVESGSVDIEWLERLNASMSFAKDIVYALSLLLLIAVVLIIGNTIRLNILNKRDEIVVMKLVGATDAFIHRPFLYTGFWYGLLGGVVAWFCITVLLVWLGFTLQKVFNTFNVELDITGLDISALVTMMLVSIIMGLLGSFLSVRKHVRSIEPE